MLNKTIKIMSIFYFLVATESAGEEMHQKKGTSETKRNPFYKEQFVITISGPAAEHIYKDALRSLHEIDSHEGIGHMPREIRVKTGKHIVCSYGINDGQYDCAFQIDSINGEIVDRILQQKLMESQNSKDEW